ncbi:MAG TPA: pyridoxal-phosphate dependent enzyme, partial [Thiolapillus brandeum]|nr:pyridoxal-phosphate dependent enzyme [Thiolapillus brandeum]
NSAPRMVGYQAAGSAPFLRGGPVDNPETVATAIRIGHPQSWDKAWNAQKASDGWFDECTDEEILAAQKLLAEKEGVFCEPASATSLAGAMRDIRSGKIPEGSRVVCTLTGNGLKDPDTAIRQCTAEPIVIEAKLAAVKDAILGNMK